jgi:hypothetical protein
MSGPVPEVDWVPLLKYPESEIECQCGVVFRSHCKAVTHEGKFVRVLRKPCPTCNRQTNPRRASSEPEQWTIGT